jgi:2-oxoglutarate ferredoxin oxidoreductase subunit delta
VAEEIEGTFHHTPLYPASIGTVSKQEEHQTNIGTKIQGEAIIPAAFVADKSDDEANLKMPLGPENIVEEQCFQVAFAKRKGEDSPMTTAAPRLIDYPSIQWNADWCKRCYICVEACPRQALELKNDAIIEIEGRCDRTGLCQRLCPDMAIEVRAPRSKGENR